VIDADIATVSGAADKVLHVGTPDPYLLHLEFVSGHDVVELPRKIHVRNGLLEYRHDLPVRSVAILLRSEADSPRITGFYEHSLPGEESYLQFQYRPIRVWQMSPEPLLTGGTALLPLAPISDVTEEDLPGIIKRMGERLRRPRERKKAGTVWAAAYLLLGLRYSPSLAALLFRGVVSMKESTTYQAILEEGRTEGRVEGRSEGRAEGAIAEAKKMLRLFGSEAFGAPDSGTARSIDQINDLAQLEELCKRAPSARSWQELLNSPTASRRRKKT
jgi:predicted transposase YdaD